MTDTYTHPQLDRLTSVIYTARWLKAIGKAELATDREIAKAILQEGFVIPQATLPTPVTTMLRSWDNEPDYSPDSPHYGKPHEDCCK